MINFEIYWQAVIYHLLGTVVVLLLVHLGRRKWFPERSFDWAQIALYWLLITGLLSATGVFMQKTVLPMQEAVSERMQQKVGETSDSLNQYLSSQPDREAVKSKAAHAAELAEQQQISSNLAETIERKHNEN